MIYSAYQLIVDIDVHYISPRMISPLSLLQLRDRDGEPAQPLDGRVPRRTERGRDGAEAGDRHPRLHEGLRHGVDARDAEGHHAPRCRNGRCG